MSKRSSSRRKRASNRGWLAPALLLAVMVIAGCALLRPVHHKSPERAHEPVAVATPVGAAPTPALETPTVSPSLMPTASPSPAGSPSPAASLPPAPPRVGNPNAPKLALVVDDCGQWIDTERGFVALPIPVTLSVLPDVRYATTIANEANGAGKGVMLHLPMETLSGLNPGPGKVTTEMSDAQIEARVREDLAQVPLAQGVNNHEGSKASADPRVMRDVVSVLATHGNLFFVDSRTNAASVGAQVAAQAGVPTASRDVFLDNHADVAYSEGQLREAAAIAERTGSAIAIGHPRPTTLAAVRALIPELEAKGITFVLVQSLTH